MNDCALARELRRCSISMIEHVGAAGAGAGAGAAGAGAEA